MKPMRRGFTLVELLVVIAIIAVLIGLLLPAVQAARSAAARIKCENNLKQIGIGLHLYHNSYNVFPPGLVGDGLNASTCPSCPPSPMPGQYGSWLLWILPFVEQSDLYAQMNTASDQNANCTSATSPGATPLALYICPADFVPQKTILYGGLYFGVNSYFGNAGIVAGAFDDPSVGGAPGHGQGVQPSLDGVLYINSNVSIGNVSAHGTTNTFLAGERYSFDPSFGTDTTDEAADLTTWRGWAWADWNSTGDVLCDTSYEMNSQAFAGVGWNPAAPNGITIYYRKTNFGSGHPPGGANFLMCDGSVHYVRQTVSDVTYERLSMASDPHVVELP
jgi:prepilin-type N-terminal cleavage/methylation domain-containing protein/prepilin-type processing-associated H-X9-DG protein